MSGVWEGLSTRLGGRIVVLEPLASEHAAGLYEAALDSDWGLMSLDAAASEEAFDEWLADAVAEAAAGESVPFVTLSTGSGRPIGSTRYLALRPEHRVLEIGWTWLARMAWNTGANVEAKLLMLEHAFERHGCLRVEFKTDAKNERSRRALAALPAEFEGVFRKHMLVRGGERRDSAWYAIVDDDWPEVKANLERRLAERARA
jgi:RimJ/RimL family protein N-acetyltransferase